MMMLMMMMMKINVIYRVAAQDKMLLTMRALDKKFKQLASITTTKNSLKVKIQQYYLISKKSFNKAKMQQ